MYTYMQISLLHIFIYVVLLVERLNFKLFTNYHFISLFYILGKTGWLVLYIIHLKIVYKFHQHLTQSVEVNKGIKDNILV